MKIAIASTGRFHVLDLSRELSALGHQVRFYSYVPKKRAVAFGLPAASHVSLLPAAAPYLAWERLLPQCARDARQAALYKTLNRAVVRRLQPCDAFICMSGVYLEAAEYARKAFGSLIYLERGSMHIDTQNAILRKTAGKQISNLSIERERAGYKLADRIAIPSMHVAASFADYPELAGKMFVNPYGVDLSMFPQRTGPSPNPRRILFVGNWSYQKGVDVLTEAVSGIPDCELVHVGAIQDAPLPDAPWFTHHDPVDQPRLSEFYQSAGLFAIASRQEGLAMVQLQALASGLPVVCTDQSGGRDAGHSPALSGRIRAAPTGDVAAFRDALTETLEKVAGGAAGSLPDPDRQLLSWRGYGQRYATELEAAELRLQGSNGH